MPRRRYTDDQIRDAVATSSTMSEVLRKVGLVPRGGNFDVMWRHIRRLDLDAEHLRSAAPKARVAIWREPTVEELRAAVASSRSLATVLRKLGCSVHSHTYRRLHKRIQEHAIDTSHLTGKAWNRGLTMTSTTARPLEEFLRDGVACSSNTLKKRLIREGVKEPTCETCGLRRWLGEPITLELDHINGHRDDNRLENLRLLCPNCHSATGNWRGRNIGRTQRARQLRIF